jgi:hypothetical protein
MHEAGTGESSADSPVAGNTKTRPPERPPRPPWARADQLTLFFIVVTFSPFVGSTFSASR